MYAVFIVLFFVWFQMHVMDSKLFTVEPKCGKLSPEEFTTVTLTYQ